VSSGRGRWAVDTWGPRINEGWQGVGIIIAGVKVVNTLLWGK